MKPIPTRRRALKLGAGMVSTLALLPVRSIAQSQWPAKPIKVINPWPPDRCQPCPWSAVAE
jgi:hypothetical protein